MKKRAQIALSAVAAALSVVGLALVVATLIHLRSVEQLRHLLSYEYMSFVDSQAEGSLGSVANDFFTGVGLLLVGSVLFAKIEKTSRAAGIVAAVFFVFVAFSLGYACLNLRIGVKPY